MQRSQRLALGSIGVALMAAAIPRGDRAVFHRSVGPHVTAFAHPFRPGRLLAGVVAVAIALYL